MKISVLIPAYNEEEAIKQIIRDIINVMNKTKHKYEIIAVDDGSTDKTAEIAKKAGATVYSHPYNIGYGEALKNGIKNAKGDHILIVDADGSYSASEIPKLLKHIDKYDMIVGARIGKNVKIPIFRRPAKFVLSKLANYLTGIKIPDLNSGLRIFKKDIALKFFNLLPPKFSFTTTITLAFFSEGYSVKYVPISYYKRKGKSKIKPIMFFDFILLIVRSIIYFNPLKIFLPISAFLFLTALAMLLYGCLVLGKIIFDITITVLILTGVQIAFFGLLADLVSKKK